MKVTFLGTGMLTSKAKSTSFIVDEHILFDIGNGVTDAVVDNNIETNNIDTVVVSHHHTDHFGDIIYFITRRFLMGGTNKTLTIIGPSGTQEKVEALYNIMNADVKGGKLLEFSNLKYVELGDEEIYNLPGITIKAFHVVHGANHCNGYLAYTETSSLGYSGDNEFCEELIKVIPLAKNWIIEANDIEGMKGWHIGIVDIEKLASENWGANFYAVHRQDKKYSSDFKNVFLPTDGQSISI